MTFPIHFDLTPDGNITPRATVGEKGYAENIEFSLQINFNKDGTLNTYYYGENDQVIELYQYVSMMELEETE